MGNDLIVVKTLPVIEDQLRSVKEKVEEEVAEALSMACTEDTYKSVKAKRSELNKQFKEFEVRRKEVRDIVMAPLDRFQATYDECVGSIYKDADAKLKARIEEIENGLKEVRVAEIRAYFDEYRDSLKLDAELVNWDRAEIKVILSDSKKSQKEKAKEYIDHIMADLEIINLQEYASEIFVEYKQHLNLSTAMLTVNRRHEAIEREKQRREAAEQAKAERERREAEVREALEKQRAEEELQNPVEVPDPEAPPEIHDEKPVEKPKAIAKFWVRGSRDDLVKLANFLKEGGYEYGTIRDE